MARLRSNFQGGQIDTLVDTTAGGTGFTLSSPGLANMPTIANPDYMAITLDPDGINGSPEICWLTAHTSGATTATFTGSQELTVGRVHPVDEYWIHGPTAYDITGSVLVYTSFPVDSVGRSSSTLGSLSTPWTLTVPNSPSMVKLELTVSSILGGDNVSFFAIAKNGSILVQTGPNYTASGGTRTQTSTFVWMDTSPGTAPVYEVYVADAGGASMTIYQAAGGNPPGLTSKANSVLIATAYL